jgi:predicted HTH transcriptional regulator
VFLIGGIYKKIVESIKVIYFTIFYTSLSKSNNIIPELKEELTNYLLMKSEGTNSDTIKDYINQCKAKGFSDKQIKEQLISQGYKDKIKNYF